MQPVKNRFNEIIGEFDDIEVALKNAEFSVVSIDTKNAPQRQITPHKGGRTVKKSTDVTPEVDSMLAVFPSPLR